MPGIKELKTRIRSVQSTRKITRAMQMVSAAKMKKAQNAALSSRTYSSLAWELIMNLAKGKNFSAALLKSHPEAKKIGILLLTSNRGMVGNLNANLLSELVKIKKQYPDREVEVVAYGRKGKEGAVRSSQQIIADFPKQDRTIAASDAYPIANYLVELFTPGEYFKIFVIYNHFVSTVTQKPIVKQLLPFSSVFSKVTPADEENPEEEVLEKTGYNYIFEPTPRSVFRHLLPRIVESQVYQAMVESEASEQSARMIMMKNATDAAGDLIADYTLTYNQLRQNKITTELAEITAGRIALE